MRRSTLVLMCSVLVLAALVPGVGAQDGPELNVQCVTVAGTPQEAAWDEFSLQDAIAAGSAELTVVGPGADCAVPDTGVACMTVAGAAPTAGWTRDTLTEAISIGRAQVVLLAGADECKQVIAETIDPVDAPERLPLELVDSGIVIGNLSSSFVAIVANPNQETWAAQGLPIAVRVLDRSGALLETTTGFGTFLPGQVGAVMGFLTTTEKPNELDLSFEGADFNWIPTELAADLLAVSDVKLKKDPVMGFVTSGKIRNTGETALEGVSVYVVHRDKAGSIIGAELTSVERIPAGKTVGFEAPNLSGVGRKQVAETDVYYQLSSVL